jgi:hypothetical protein
MLTSFFALDHEVWMTRLGPSLLDVAKIVQPETILRWHAFRLAIH